MTVGGRQVSEETAKTKRDARELALADAIEKLQMDEQVAHDMLQT